MRILSLLVFMIVALIADIGVIGAFKGDANLVRNDEVLNISSGMKLQEHDTLTTQKEATVQLIMKDQTIITIGPSSNFQIDSYRFESDRDNSLDFSLKQGFFRAITGKIGKLSPERFKIHTKSATIGIRGTDFAAYVDLERENIACFSGSIEVATQEEVFEIHANRMLTLIESRWQEFPLDIQKFTQILVSDGRQENRHHLLKAPFDASVIENLTQQERLQNAGFEITPGYEIISPPPVFVP